MASGAAHCQFIDMMYPGKIPLGKVNFNAKQEYEFVNNYAILQETFGKLGIDKPVEVSILIKSKPQANLEFTQWMKKFFEANYNPEEEYNALNRRISLGITCESDKVLMAELGIKAPPRKPAASSLKKVSATTPASTISKPVAPTVAAAKKPAAIVIPKSGGAATKPIAKSAAATPATTLSKPTPTTSKPATTTAVKPTVSKPAAVGSKISARPSTTTTTTVDPNLLKELEEKKKMIAELTQEVTNLQLSVELITNDRTFYLKKLEEVEQYCQNNESEEKGGHLQAILEILYFDPDKADQEGEEEEEVVQEEELLEEGLEGEGEGEGEGEIELNGDDELLLGEEGNEELLEDFDEEEPQEF
eukprot:gene8617-10607_t